MRFEILGPMRVSGRGREISVRAGRDRALLAMLVLHANRSVPVADLVEALWADTAPKHARGQLHGCVSRLRKQFASIGLGDRFITTEPEGYRLLAGNATVDLLEFRGFVAKARVAARAERPGEARDAYRAALALWRGPALADIDRGTVRQAAAGLDEERTQALEECIDLELVLGGAGELIGELTELGRQHQYRDRLHAALMLALYRADRQADALAAYQRIRQTLVTELGQEPGHTLRALHQRILTGDETLRAGEPGQETDAHQQRPASRQLPRTLNDFTGRQDDLTWLIKIASQADPYAPLVVTIDGMPGVGKTSLAVRAAHVLESRFPDGQLFVDLHGHSKRAPLEPAAALSTLLRQLGVPATQIASDLDERIAQWHVELAGRRAIVVLDNAASIAQVSPLLPASAGCFALVTSRRRLLDLDGARPLSVSTLDPEDAVALLERIVGPRVAAEPDAAAEVAKRCGYLPIALRLAAARLAHRPRWQVGDLADRLANPQSSLAELAAGDRTVTDTFALSYSHLSPDGQRLFRLLGLHPGEHFDVFVAAALTGSRLESARRLLDELIDAHVVQEPLAGRYRLHDLLKEYASELTETVDAVSERDRAVQQLLDYYVHGTASACSQLKSRGGRQEFEPDKPPMRLDLIREQRTRGTEWLELERATLVSAIHYAAAQGYHRYTWLLARASWRFLFLRGYLDELVDTHRLGLAAAQQLNDDGAAATMHNYLASAYFRFGQSDEAAEHVRQALAHHMRTGDRIEEAITRGNLATVLAFGGRRKEATDECQRALAAATRSNDPFASAYALVNGSAARLWLGQYDTALPLARRALAIARELGHQHSFGTALANVGIARARLGQTEPAFRLLRAALRLRRLAYDRWGEAETLNELGAVCRALGRLEEALAHHKQALALVHRFGFRQEECVIYSELGRTLLAGGDVAAARETCERALARATKIQHRYGQARALDGIGSCLRKTDPESARQYWLRALRLYHELDAPERHDVERHLATLAA